MEITLEQMKFLINYEVWTRFIEDGLPVGAILVGKREYAILRSDKVQFLYHSDDVDSFLGLVVLPTTHPSYFRIIT